ncbi:TPA: hypothetical protein DEP96_02035 [Candidatus Uhrbacteria bacterium]|nr:hypothetical protein [Candidatus Uhrbacteria bacterium]
MANDQFQKLLRFARRTGDRLIVTDQTGGEPLVILPFEQYEALVNGFLGPDEGEMAELEAEHDHAGHSHPHGRSAEVEAEPEVEVEFQAEGEEEIGEIEIDPIFLAQPAAPVLEIIEPSPSPRYEPEPRPEPRPVPQAEPRAEPRSVVNTPLSPPTRPPEPPRQPLAQAKNNGGEEQFYLEPL